MSDCLTEENLQEEYYDETSSLFEQEFSEQDVLPFLLQAQDIISKLESRVVELETDLSTIHRKYEYDRNDWLVGLSQKDQYINHLSSKLQKSEFNSKETIVLLSDLSSTGMMDEQVVKSTITLCLNYLRQTEPEPTNIRFNEEDTGEDLEEGELERRQAAVTEWRRSDIPDHFSTDPAYNQTCDNNVVNLMDGLSSLSSSPSLSSTCSHHINNNTKSNCIEQQQQQEEELEERIIPTTYVVNNDDDNNNFCTNCKQLLTQIDQQIEQKAYLRRDLSSLASALSDEKDIRSAIEQDKEALEQDVGDITSSLFLALNQILMDEVTDRDGLVQIHRETMGKLSHVLDAWDTRDSRLKQVKELLVQLDSVVHQSANASCTIARRYSSHPQPSSIPINNLPTTPTTVSRLAARSSFINHPLRFSLDQQPLQQQQQQQSNNQRIDRNTIRIDGFILSEFQLHIKAVTENPSIIIPNTPFVKRVLAEDVEPCLFFQQSQGWWKSPWFKKKLLDAISKNKCEIQGWHDNSSIFSIYTTTTNSSSSVSTSPATSHISSSSQQSMTVPMPPKTKCACCNILRVCEFKMRLPPPTAAATATSKKRNSIQPQPWLPIDRFCRDRLVAVCGYYSFMSHLKLLLASSPLLSTFKQVMHHRRKMSLAKVGSIGLFIDDEDEDDYNDIINRRLSSSSNTSSSSKRQYYQQQRRQRRNRESIVFDHSGSGSDTASIVSVSDIQGLDSNSGQIVIVH